MAHNVAEHPFYLSVRTDDTLTVKGDIPLHVLWVEKRMGGGGMVGLVVYPPASAEVEFDAATKTLRRIGPP
jgi:hypothetical protein